jgi:polar amino acid transport system substrate-binding protein
MHLKKWGLISTFLFFAFSPIGGVKAAESPVLMGCNNFPPFKIQENKNDLPGFVVEFIEEIFIRIKRPIKIDFLPWKRILRNAKTGQMGGLCSCSRTKERDAFLLYSNPLGKTSSGIFLLKKNGPLTIKELADLPEGKIGVVDGYNLKGHLIKAGKDNILNAINDQSAIKMLARERFKYLYNFDAPIFYYLRNHPNLKNIQYTNLSNNPYYACFSKKSPKSATLVKEFNKALSSIRADGTYEKIISKYKPKD